MNETFKKQFSKTGESDFYVSKVNINSNLPFMNVSSINQLRRDCFSKLMDKRLKEYKRETQKPWNKTHAPRKDEPGFEEQVKKLSDQVKLISEKLAYLTPNEQRSVLVNNHKKASKQVWVKKEDNLCLVSHTALKILDTCLWYLDSGCSKHMTGDKTLLKEVQMGKGGRITYGDGSQSRVIGKGIIDIPGLGTSQEALYVEGLKANLLSISQFCDNDFCTLGELTQKDFPKCTETCGQWPNAHKYGQHKE